ncbi:NAD(P)-binding protein [Dehalobacter sp. DCM]|uniref:pyridine nucleotide-disulfide oxidoreductase/dicluster-binding protein n=1 Tax=Dehalobacter sp. DCM TaxID=2907827 RepID=UPI0030817C49|nr:NAD(P)-binding protein [Dehalobacter sp. DCM]
MEMDTYAIQEMARLCTHNEMPSCVTHCPLHVDLRTLIGSIQKGQYAEAAKLYRRQVLFPEILSRICDQPCQKHCLRGNWDEPIAIRSLEKASMDFGKVKKERSYPIQPKNKRIAVIGGGLSGLACAIDLVRKGYQVDLYEQNNRLGGSLWEYDPQSLPLDIIEKEMTIPLQAGVNIYLNTKIMDRGELYQDAIFYSAIELSGDFDQDYEPVSLASGMPGVFGRGKEDKASMNSPVYAIAVGLRAARSIERYFQNASLTAGREKEGCYPAQTHVTLPVVKSKQLREKMSDPAAGYNQQEAADEAARCWLCSCTECWDVCPYIRRYKAFPDDLVKTYGKNMYAYPAMGKSSATSLINACSLCGLCKEVCPGGLDMTAASINARRIMVERGIMPMAVHDFSLRDMLFSNGSEYFLAKHQPGMNSSRYLFFPGCQLGASDPDYVLKTYDYLIEKLDGGVGLLLGCCGVPALWSGRNALFQQQIDQITQTWQKLGQPEVILTCPTCQNIFREFFPGIIAQSLWQIIQESLSMNELSDNFRIEESGKELMVHDPCASRYDREMQDTARFILRQSGIIPGELPLNREKTQCCGYGGLIATVNPELASEISLERIQYSDKDYVTYCVNCRDDFARHGKPTWHLLDVLFFAKDPERAKRKAPSYSQRRENRWRLREKLLNMLWGEAMQEKQAIEDIKLIICSELAEQLDRDLILVDEVKEVLRAAQNTGKNVLIIENGNYLTHKKMGLITYWVEYQVESDYYRVLNAYSHRMQIVEDVKDDG